MSKIVDPIIEPYFILIDENGFELIKSKEVTKSKSTERIGGIREVKCGYFSSLDAVLYRLVRIKAIESGDIFTIQGYIEKQKEILTQITNIVK